MGKIKDLMTKLTIATVSVAGLALYSSGAAAVTQTETANIAFDTSISFTGVTAINFGIVSAGVAATTYKIDTTGAVTTTSGPGVWLGSAATTAGSMVIHGSATATINITANNYVANGGVTPTLARCAYNGGAEAACTTLSTQAAPGAAGKTLLIGVSATTTGAEAAGATASPTVDIVVTYT